MAMGWPYAFTIVPIEEVEQVKQSESFDPVAFVDGIWETRLIPTMEEKAVDLSTILNEMKPGADGTVAKDNLIPIAQNNGLITVGEAHVYIVMGKGQVVDVNTQSSTGNLTLLLDGYNGPIQVKLYIGTRIPSDETSIRDSVGFINFGDFKEQTEYGKVASELNKRVNAQVLSGLDKENLQGKTISFVGAFTIRTFNLININLSEIKIVPVKLTVE
jgi:predicted lipoprotein